MRRAENRQIPWESSSLTGDFYFKAGSSTQTTSCEATAVDVVAWNAIEDSTNAADIEGYIAAYPESELIPIAQSHLKALQEPKVAALPAAKADTREPSMESGRVRASQRGGGDCSRSIDLVLNIAAGKVMGVIGDFEYSAQFSGSIDDEGHMQAVGYDEERRVTVIGNVDDTTITGTWDWPFVVDVCSGRCTGTKASK